MAYTEPRNIISLDSYCGRAEITVAAAFSLQRGDRDGDIFRGMMVSCTGCHENCGGEGAVLIWFHDNKPIITRR